MPRIPHRGFHAGERLFASDARNRLVVYFVKKSVARVPEALKSVPGFFAVPSGKDGFASKPDILYSEWRCDLCV
jgi:hypothetical protein